MAQRVRIGAGTFMLFAVIASGMDMYYFPRRAWAVEIVFGLYAAICGGTLSAVHFWPRATMMIGVTGALLLLPAMALYHFLVGNYLEILLMPLGLYLCATTAIMPWGGVGQFVACVVAGLIEILCSTRMVSLLPWPYIMAGFAGIGFVTVPCCEWLEQMRWTAWEDARRAERAILALSTALGAAKALEVLAMRGPAGYRRSSYCS
jgi:membrane-bound ClpP family serine protease